MLGGHCVVEKEEQRLDTLNCKMSLSTNTDAETAQVRLASVV